MATQQMLIAQGQRAVPVTKAKVDTGWGWLQPIMLFQAFALVLVAIAYTENKKGTPWATGLFWLGQVMIFAPTAYRVSLTAIARKERIGLIVATGLALYLVKVLYTPQHFLFHDEFLHWRTATDILLTGHLFTANPILTVSPLYPGLEIITTAFANVSGLTVVESGLITLGVVRVMFMLALYLFYEQIGRSAQIGSIAALLYFGNSNFFYFDSQFSYESLSLPLATAILYIVLLQQRARGRGFIRLLILVLPLIVTVAITHHLTAYVMAGLLLAWSLVAFIAPRTRRQSLNIGIVAILTFVIVAAWTRFTGNIAEGYLLPVIGGGIGEFIALILNEEGGRQLFQGAAGLMTPFWERIIGILSIIFVVGVLPFGLLEIWHSPFRNPVHLKGIRVLTANVLRAWYRYRNNALVIVFAGIVVLYPIMLIFRFTSSGWEIANRSSEFIFWAIAFVLAIGALGLRSYRRLPPQLWTAGFVVWITVIFLGGSVAGWPHWARLPGPYMVSADARSIEPQGIAAATWAGSYLDPQDRIAADRVNTLLLATYGLLMPVTHQYDNLYISPVFLSSQIGSNEYDLIRRTDLHYALVDDRLSTALPTVGVYFEAGEPGADQYIDPPSLTNLTKFDRMPTISRIFDSGHIKIYDVSVLNRDP